MQRLGLTVDDESRVERERNGFTVEQAYHQVPAGRARNDVLDGNHNGNLLGSAIICLALVLDPPSQPSYLEHRLQC